LLGYAQCLRPVLAHHPYADRSRYYKSRRKGENCRQSIKESDKGVEKVV
jgi:hypothetical protein